MRDAAPTFDYEALRKRALALRTPRNLNTFGTEVSLREALELAGGGIALAAWYSVFLRSTQELSRVDSEVVT